MSVRAVDTNGCKSSARAIRQPAAWHPTGADESAATNRTIPESRQLVSESDVSGRHVEQVGGASLMVKNCTLGTRWDRDDLRTDSQGTQFPASQTGILWPTVVAAA